MTLVIALSSCSNDDDKNKEEFFNLKVGNEWVYKRYDVDNQGIESTYEGYNIDTVKVVGKEIIDGNEYFKLTHSNYLFDDEELLRVDENGYLVSSDGYVVHPGIDKDYNEVRDVLNGNGVINYTLKEVTSIAVENKNYEVYPFSGYYTPNPGNLGTEGVAAIEAYSKGVGLVIRRYKYLAGMAYFEYRLVSYDLK